MRNVRILQLTLERRYEEAVRLQEEKLARTDRPPSERGGDREWLGWLRSLAGDTNGARQAYLEAKPSLELLQQQQPRNTYVAVALANCEAGLGNKEAALREAERAMSLLPASEDPMTGPKNEETLAGIEGRVGELERAIARIERLLITPYGAFPLHPGHPAARSPLGSVTPASALQSSRGRTGAEDHLSVERHEEFLRRTETPQRL